MAANRVKAAQKTESWDAQEDRQGRNGEHLEALETKAPKTATTIMLPRLDIRTANIKLVGDSPLICHRWSEKARKQMLDKQMGVASAGKEHKDPEADFWGSLYHMQPGQEFPHKEGYRYGFPTIAFKNAAVTACTSLGKSITKVAARQAFHVMGELVEIEGTPRMREDMVRVGQGTADIRFRAEFLPWVVNLQVRYNVRVLSLEQVVNLFNTAGFAVGVGEWRSERDGSYGLFHIE